jgi:hypothetical protein
MKKNRNTNPKIYFNVVCKYCKISFHPERAQPVYKCSRCDRLIKLEKSVEE